MHTQVVRQGKACEYLLHVLEMDSYQYEMCMIVDLDTPLIFPHSSKFWSRLAYWIRDNIGKYVMQHLVSALII